MQRICTAFAVYQYQLRLWSDQAHWHIKSSDQWPSIHKISIKFIAIRTFSYVWYFQFWIYFFSYQFSSYIYFQILNLPFCINFLQFSSFHTILLRLSFYLLFTLHLIYLLYFIWFIMLSLEGCRAAISTFNLRCVYMHGSRSQFSKSHMHGSFFAVYCHVLFRVVCTTGNNHLRQMFTCTTVNVKAMLLDFFYMRISCY